MRPRSDEVRLLVKADRAHCRLAAAHRSGICSVRVADSFAAGGPPGMIDGERDETGIADQVDQDFHPGRHERFPSSRKTSREALASFPAAGDQWKCRTRRHGCHVENPADILGCRRGFDALLPLQQWCRNALMCGFVPRFRAGKFDARVPPGSRVVRAETNKSGLRWSGRRQGEEEKP